MGRCGNQPVSRLRRAFSLVELIVVIGVISILISLLLPTLSAARESARTVQCQSNLRQIGQAMLEYVNVYQGALPTHSGWQVYPDGSSPEDEPGLGWTEQLMLVWGQAPTAPVFHCPDFPDDLTINYFLSSRWVAMKQPSGLKMSDIVLSSQFVLSGDCTTRIAYRLPFGVAPFTTIDCDPSDESYEYLRFGDQSYGVNIHRRGNNVLFADGHVETFESFDPVLMTYDPTTSKSWDQVN